MSFLCKWIGHRWDGCRCVRCGAQRNEGHRWTQTEGACEQVCSICGRSEPTPCAWNHCVCTRCGQTRDSHHDWMATAPCEEVCRVCGKERDNHDWHGVSRGVDRCAACGKTRRLTAEEIARRDEEWQEQGDEFVEDAPTDFVDPD